MFEIQDLFRKLKPFYGNRINDLWKVYLMEDRDGKNEIENTLQIMESNILGGSIERNEPILVPPPAETIKGPFTLGNIVYGGQKQYPFGLYPKELTSHVCITGATGRGKTNFCLHLIKNLLRENVPFLLFDFKRSIRDLLEDPIPYAREIKVFTVGRDVSPFRYNPLLPPPGIDPKTWIDRIIDILIKVQYAGLGVAALLRKAIDNVYRSAGLYDGSPLQRQPVLKDALTYLQNYKPKGREINWMSSTVRSIEALCFGEMGDILNSNEPMDLIEILNQNVVFELDAPSPTNKVFFIESILAWFHAYRLHQGGDETLKHVCIIEEAHRLLKKSDHQTQTHDSILDIWITEARQLGEGLVILAQTPSILPAIALGNTYTSICLNLKHASDIHTMSRVLLLKDDQKDDLGKLELGKAIVKLQGRWLSPFLIDVPLYPIQKGSVNDEKLKKLMEPYFTDSTPKEAQNGLYGKFQASPQNDKYTIKKDHLDFNKELYIDNLSQTDKSILMDIRNYPGSGVVERYRRLQFSRRKGNNAKGTLLNHHLIREIPVVTKKGKVILIELTIEGLNAIPQKDINNFNRKRTGGAVHEYWKEKIKQYYEKKGFRVVREMPVNGGKTVDLCVFSNGKRIAIEVETGKSNAELNIRKNLNAGFDEIISVAVDEEILKKLKNDIYPMFTDREKIRLVCANDFDI